jgi:hypothetical protein
MPQRGLLHKHAADTRQDWMTAGASYHSMTPVLAAAYRSKLTALLTGWRSGADWVQIKPMKDIWDDAALEKAKAANLAWRESQLAEYRKLRAARLSALGSTPYDQDMPAAPIRRQ